MDQGQNGVVVNARPACAGQPDKSCRYLIDLLHAAQGQIIGAKICFQNINPLMAVETLDHNLPPADRTPHVGRRSILEALPEGVFTINTKWRIVSFNSQVAVGAHEFMAWLADLLLFFGAAMRAHTKISLLPPAAVAMMAAGGLFVGYGGGVFSTKPNFKHGFICL